MTQTPFVSVIVPVYNDAARLRLCLSALARQSYPRDAYEVIVVDNGSDDDLHVALSAHPDCLLEREDRVGSYAARNKGIDVSKGEILAFTDSDCVPDGNWLRAGVDELLAAPECGAVGGPIEMFPPTERRLTAFDRHDLVWGMPQRIYIERFGLSATANLFARREAFARVGPFEANFRSAGDCEWCFRLTSAGLGLRFAPEARVAHPTRGSLYAFVQRRRRIAGGYHRLQPLLETSYVDRDFQLPRGLRVSLTRIRRNMKHRRLDTATKKLQFATAELLLYAVTLLEGWRLRLGGTPSRG